MMWNFKNIKFAFLVLGILSTINIVWVETEGFVRSLNLLRFGGGDYFTFNISPDFQVIISSFIPYIFMRIWEAYYR